jgi:hypothetical protein
MRGIPMHIKNNVNIRGNFNTKDKSETINKSDTCDTYNIYYKSDISDNPERSDNTQ